MVLCPKEKIIRSVDSPGADRIEVVPVEQTANIDQIVANTDLPVHIRFLSFHTKGNAYCVKYKDENAEKRLCGEPPTDYVQFYLLKEKKPPDKYILAFLPRSKKDGELEKVADELYTIAQWLNVGGKINGIVFRYGKPVQSSDNVKHSRDVLECHIKVKKWDFCTIEVIIKTATSNGNKKLTISNNKPFESINVC
jgi:hypothetical protein